MTMRPFRRSPGLALTVILTLALGIGANAAIFTIARAALLEPLPYAAPHRLVHLAVTPEAAPATRLRASYPELEEWRALRSVLVAVGGYDETNVTVAASQGGTAGSLDAEMLQGARITTGFFRMLGVRPERGRDFRSEDELPGAAPVVILGHDFWTRVFAGDPRALGAELEIDGRRHTVIGVLPPQFHFAPIGRPELWFPLDLGPASRADAAQRRLTVVGRLRDGVTLERAAAEVSAAARRLAVERPASNRGLTVRVIPLREWFVGDVRPLLLLLMGAVAIILFIACANIAGLLLSHALSRAPEIAVRAALGASRFHLITQLLGESMVLTLIGGAVGLWVASLGMPALIAMMPPTLLSDMPNLDDVALDHGVVAFTFGVTLLTGVAAGFAPALYASRPNLAALITQGARTTAPRARSGPGDVLVIGQVALTFILLVTAGLTTRSLVRLLATDPGFDASHVLTMRVALPGARYGADTVQQRIFETLLSEVRAMPGVRAAGAISSLPLSGSGTTALSVEGRITDPTAPAARLEAMTRTVAGDYFAALAIPTIAGRTFTSADRSDSPHVVVVSQSLARTLFPAVSAIGQRIRLDGPSGRVVEIVGIVGDVRAASLGAPPPPMIYHSHRQRAENRMSLALRVEGDATHVVSAVRSLVRAIDPALPVYAIASMDSQIASSPAVAARRYPLVLVGAFSVAALLLAMIGIHGVISYAVTRRMREFGIRIALGARGSDILRLALGHGLSLGAWGILTGIALAFPLVAAVRPLLYGVPALDPATWIAVMALLGGATVLAGWLPAWRAARVNPVDSLRVE